MGKKYDLAPEFRWLPTIKLPANRTALRIANALIALNRIAFTGDPAVARHIIHAVSGTNKELSIIRFDPKNAARRSPAIVYFHGGAFALGQTRRHLRLCEKYARETSSQVFLPTYRLAIDHPFPAALDDCFAALTWILENADQLNIDPTRVVVGGDSAGGALAAGVAQRAADEGLPIHGQFLVYPVIDHRMTSGSARDFVDTPIWTSSSSRRMWQLYLRLTDFARSGGTAPLPPYAAPLARGHFSGLPPTFIEVVEFDPLRDEGLAYAEALRSAGVAVEEAIVRRAPHGYDLFSGGPVTRAALDNRMDALRRLLSMAAS